MFILRSYTGENHEVNECLGNSYHLVSREGNLQEFKRTFTASTGGMEWDENDPSDNKIYCLVVYSNGSKVIPLYRPSTYYIMTDSGATFANLTFK